MDDFLIELQAKLDEAKSKENFNGSDGDIARLQKQLDHIKIQAELDPKAAQNLANEIGKLVNQKITISNIGIDTGSISKSGEQAGKQFSDGISKGLNNNSSALETFKRSLKKIGMGSEEIDAVAKRINNLGVQIESLNQTKSHTSKKDILSVNISGVDKLGQAVKLTEQYDIATGDLIKSIDSVSTAQQKAGATTDTFVEKQKKTVTDLTNKLNKYYREGIDQSSSKPIKDQAHLSELKQRYDEIVSAIGKVGTASKNSFGDEQNSVNTLISDLQILIKEYKNAETVATSLRSKDISTVKSEYSSKLDNLVTKMKSSGLYTDGFQKGTNNLSNILKNATDASGLTSFLNGLDKLDAGYKRAKVSAEAFNQSQKVGIKVSGLQSKIDDLQRISPEIDKFKTQINGAEVSVQSLCDDLSKVSTQSDLSVVNEKWRSFRDAAKAAGIAVTEVATKSGSLTEKDIKLSIGDKGDTTTQIKTLSNNFTKLGLSADEVKSKMSGVDIELTQLKTLLNSGANNSAITSQFNKLQLALKEAQNDLKATRSEYSLLVSAQQRLSKANTIEAWRQKNSAATKQAKADTQAYIDSLRNLNVQMTRMEFDQISRGFKETEISMRGLNRLGSSLKDQFSQAAQSFTQWLSVSSGIMTLVYQLQKMPKEVYEIDTAMTNLYKVTDETSSKYNQFLDSASTSAHDLGRSISSLVEQTADWAKLGFSLDEAEQLAKISSIYANVGEVDNDTAVSDLVTAMKAFNIEASNSITIVDSLNKLGNEFATDAASLGDGLSKSASALQLAGNDINETLAMLTGGTEITQNASEMGNALKVLSMRIRGMKGELEDLGEEYENVESISKIQTQILNQTHGHVNIFDDTGNFKTTYEILKGIAEVWDHISQTDQAALLETIAGKQRGNQIAALIQSFQSGQVEKAFEASKNAAGSAMQEQERWMESLEAKIAQFEAAFQSLSSTVLDSSLLKWFIDFGTGTVKTIDNVIDKIGSLGTIGLGAGLFAGVKNTGKRRISVRIS